MFIDLERIHVVKVNIGRNNKEYQYWCNITITFNIPLHSKVKVNMGQ